ncbi:MAG: TrkH family potassium uptake protein, partial [Clostridia bacterium]|nr:TrkH family potassium uptake protein [Clostridia bacterium]
IVFFVTLLLSFDGFAAGDPFTHLSATLACISNVGPGFNMVGPTCSFAGYSAFSKLLLSMVMIAGRLEIFPIIILFSTHTWKRG